jgi:carbon monoxide dehydrogenase subunit G
MVDSDVTPLIRALSDAAPDVHNVLEILDDLHQLASGLPGAKLLRKRGVEGPVQQHIDQRPG